MRTSQKELMFIKSKNYSPNGRMQPALFLKWAQHFTETQPTQNHCPDKHPDQIRNDRTDDRNHPAFHNPDGLLIDLDKPAQHICPDKKLPHVSVKGVQLHLIGQDVKRL